MKITRRRLLQIAATSPLWAGLSAAGGAEAAPKLDTRSFTILHANDPHGHLLPFSYPDRVAPGDYVSYMPDHANIGGVARRATLIKRLKKQGKNVFAFDAGDSMDGSPFSVEFLGKADYDAMSLCGFDFGTFGNHDFNMTAAQFQEMRGHVKYPMVLANVYHKGTGKPVEKPYTIENWDGLRVAVLGLTTFSSKSYKAIVEAYDMREPMSVASDLVPKLRKEADLVVVLSHCGYDEDKRMARDIPGIDVIIGAHSHTRLPVGDFEYAANPGKLDPAGTIIVQAHQWSGELGRLDCTAHKLPDGRWQVARYTATLLPVDDTVPEDPQVKAVVAKYWDQIKNKYAEVVGEAADEFVDVRGEDPTNYYLMCDAVLAGTPGAAFELENFGGVRAPILKGKITRYDLVGVDPFTNTIFSFGIKGSDLKKLLRYTRPATSASLRYKVRRDEKSNANGKFDWQLVEATLNGQPIEDDKVYPGAASSYYFGKEVQKYAIEPKDSARPRIEYLAEFIKKNTPVKPTADGRVVLEGGSSYE